MIGPGRGSRVWRGWVLTSLCAAVLGACGYTHEQLFRTDVRTVAVPILENRSYYQGIELDLTEALIKEIELRTPYKVTSSSEADTILQGVIVSVQQTRLSREKSGGVPQELEMRITVDYEWKNLHTGQVLRSREGFAGVGRYAPTRPISEPLEIGQHATVQRLATAMVSTMVADW